MCRFYSVVLVIFIACLPSIGQNSLTLDSLRIDPLLTSVSFNYAILGDDNLNSSMEIMYKEETETIYQPGGMTMRAHPGLVIDGASTDKNFHAGAIMLLNENTVYDVEIELNDPDGGSAIFNFQVTTRAEPQPASDPTIKYVSPGNGGGIGTMSDPYLGLQEAADNAQAGDHFIVSSGTYQEFTILNSGTETEPISFISEEQHGAIIDGENTDRGIVTIGSFSQGISHFILDGFIIENGFWALDAQNSEFITIRNNYITDVDYGYVNRRQMGLDRNQYIINNLFEGRSVWPGSGIPSERCIDLRGTQNLVRYNTIKNFADGVSADGPPQQTNFAMEIHNNDIYNIVDDNIEVDFVVSNAMVYSNRCYNGRAGVSLAPIYGGPAYIFRNIIYNTENSSFKMNRGPSGLVIAHNTVIAEGNAISSSAGWQNTFFRNNVVIGSRYCFEEFDLVSGSNDDWDYGAYFSSRNGDSGSPWFKWDNIRYNNVPELQSSGILEANALELALSDFEDIEIPTSYDIEYSSNDFNVFPINGSPVIDNGDSGDNMDHLNEHFVFDGAPDRGAIEFGQLPMRYGHIFDFESHIEISDNDIHIYPNPFTDKVIIIGEFSGYLIQVFDVTGNLVGDFTGVSSPLQIELNYLGTGMYFLHVQNTAHDDHCVFKIIKE